MQFTHQELRDICEVIETHLDDCPGFEGDTEVEADAKQDIDEFHERLKALLNWLPL